VLSPFHNFVIPSEKSARFSKVVFAQLVSESETVGSAVRTTGKTGKTSIAVRVAVQFLERGAINRPV
jgi:hypothetical protein